VISVEFRNSKMKPIFPGTILLNAFNYLILLVSKLSC
jgi:hypothetical protein